MRKIDLSYIDLEYVISSGLGSMENDRFRQKIEGGIYLTNEDGARVLQIGKLTAEKLLFDRAAENGWGVYEIFDTVEHLFQLGNIIYDYKKGDWCEEIQKFYDHDIYDENLLVLSRIEILPEYRKNDVCKFVIKDLYNNFIGRAGLFVLKCFPLQFESEIMNKDSWSESMKFEKFENDFEKARFKLLAFYKKVGFELIPELSSEIMFINPSLKNKKFDKINFE